MLYFIILPVPWAFLAKPEHKITDIMLGLILRHGAGRQQLQQFRKYFRKLIRPRILALHEQPIQFLLSFPHLPYKISRTVHKQRIL